MHTVVPSLCRPLQLYRVKLQPGFIFSSSLGYAVQDNGASVGFALAGTSSDQLSVLKLTHQAMSGPRLKCLRCQGDVSLILQPCLCQITSHRLTMMCLSAGGIFLCLGNLGTQ